MDVEYFEGEDIEYQEFVRAEFKAQRAKLQSIHGKMRWIFQREDGTEYALRPKSAK